MGWAEKAATDYSFHVAITWWDESVRKDMGTLVAEHGINSFKHFMAYKNAIMCDDETLVNSFMRAKDWVLYAQSMLRMEKLVFRLQKDVYERGIHGPEGHPLSRPPEVEEKACKQSYSHCGSSRCSLIFGSYILYRCLGGSYSCTIGRSKGVRRGIGPAFGD